MNRLHRWYCRSAHWRTTLEWLVPWALDDVGSIGDHLLELGPGPGLMTPMLAARTTRITGIDLDPIAGGVRGDATQLPFSAGTFSAVVAFSMLHHIPAGALQDRLFREVVRVLRPGGAFVGVDVRFSVRLWLFQAGDTFVPIEPATLASRLTAAGFADREMAIDERSGFFRFRVRSAAL